jgi:serine protease Do
MSKNKKNFSTKLFLCVLAIYMLFIFSGEKIGEASEIRKISKTFVEISKKVKPGVVTISSVKIVKGRKYLSPFDFFEDDFFKKFFGQSPDSYQRGSEYRTQGLGSGITVTSDGYVLTNSHVVADMDEITVILPDKREFKGEVVGLDKKTDVAVVKIKGDNLPIIELGDSDKIEVGEWVLAIGAPLGLAGTVTAGIISAKGRANVGLVAYEDFIQTDAAINRGNSGGPLVNLDGQVIGINTAITTTTGGYMGIGLAVPINMAKTVMNALVNKGKVTRGWLGVKIQRVTKDIADSFKLKKIEGVLISEVIEDTPAEKAGLKQGDVIVKYGGKAVKDTGHLRNIVAGTEVGKTVKVEIIRAEKSKIIKVKIKELPDDILAGGAVISKGKLGLTVQKLTPDIASKLGYKDELGVIVSDVEPESSAYEKGIRRGDLIIEINGSPIKNLNDFNEKIKNIKSKDKVLLLIKRRGASVYVVIIAK